MEELKPENCSYSYKQNIKFNEQSNTNYVQLQSNSGHTYVSDINTGHYTDQNKTNSSESNFNILNLTNMDSSYWEDKSFRNEYDCNSKLQENLDISRSYISDHQEGIHCDRLKNISYNSQRQHYNQWCPSYDYMNVDIASSFQKNRDQKMESYTDSTLTNTYINPSEKIKNVHCTLDSNNYMDSNLLGEVNVEEFRGTNSDLRFHYNYEYCDDLSGLHTYLGISTATSNEFSFNALDQQTETSNGDSDIIVEETDEEVVCSDYQNQNLSHSLYKCIICNVQFISVGVEFHYLTTTFPVTMTSRKPVFNKLVNLVGTLKTKENHICSQCLGLINSIDYLQSKLSSFKNELQCKFQKTCNVDGINHLRNCKKSISKKSFSSFRCKYCSKILTCRNYCPQHRVELRKRNVLCDKCGILCRSLRKFRQHTCKLSNISSKPVKMKWFSCFNCNKFYRTKTNLKEHQNFCLGISPHICNISNCFKKFSTSTRLKNHIKLKHDKKFIAICSICNIGFIKLSDYKSHKITHSTNKKFQCHICDKSYKTQSNLNFHLRSHKKSLPFICNVCGKGFMRKEYLETHINNHNNIKIFSCSKCSKTFASQKNLDSHFKYHDGTFKKKICNICGKTLMTNLNDHLRVHNNLREFDCNHCDMKFNTKGTLSKHIKIKHKSLITN